MAVNGVDGAAFEAEVGVEANVEDSIVLKNDDAALNVCVLATVAIVVEVTICVAFSAEVELPMKDVCEEVA